MWKYDIRGPIGNLCLTFICLTIIFGVGELGLRVIGSEELRKLESWRQVTFQPSLNPDIRYEFVPGASGYIWGTQAEINARGYRGRMGAPGFFPGFRILVLGDSITFGTFLPLEATYAYQMQEILDKSASEYEVLNFGVGGYDILQELALLESRGLTYKPDLVVVGFCLNDAGIGGPNIEYVERIKQYKSNLLLRSSRLAQLIINRIDRIRLRLWMWEKNRLEVFAKDHEGRIIPIGEDERELHELIRKVPEDHPSNLYRDEPRVGRLRYAFARLATLAEREQFSVVVLIFPWLVGHANSYPHQLAHEIVKLEARRAGLDTLEVLQDFMDAGMDSLRIKKTDLIHPNERGHRIVAEKLVRYVHGKRQPTISK